MEDIPYQQQITANLDELRERLWSLCCLGHSDQVLKASLEAITPARAMQEMIGQEGSYVVPSCHVLLQEPRLHNQRLRSQQGGGL